jgi:hypothetical protein
MANSLYDLGREKFLRGERSWNNDAIKAVLTDHGTDTPNVTTDDFLDDISAGTVATSPNNFSSKTTTSGVADAADLTSTDAFSAVSGATCESLNLYYASGVASTSALLVYIDTANSTLPVTPNGGDIAVQWDAGANKIFKL